MTTVYMKKQIFSHGDSFEIFNTEEDLIYTAKFQQAEDVVQFQLNDHKGNEPLVISEKSKEKRPTFEISIHDRYYGTLYKETSWQSKAYLAECDHGRYTISQYFPSTQIKISYDGSTCATLQKDTRTWRRTFTYEVEEKENLLFFLAMMLIVVYFDQQEEEMVV